VTLLISAVLLVAQQAGPASGGEPFARRIEDPADLLSGWSAEGQIGDCLLGNGNASFILEDIEHPHGEGLSGGNIVDAGVAPYWEDEFGNHLTLLLEYPRQAVYDSLVIESAGGGTDAVVLAIGHDSGDPQMAIETRYVLTRDARFLEIVTTLTNNGSTTRNLQAGDALNWNGPSPFVPGYGFDVTGTTTYSSWLAASGTGPCYGYTTLSGTIPTQHGDLWSDPLPFSGSIPPGGAESFTRYFIVGGLGLASVSDVAHALRGDPVGSVAGTISEAETGSPLPGATITCDVGGTATYTQARTDASGSYSATLFAGSYVFVASLPTYAWQEAEGSVQAQQVTTVDFELTPGSSSPEIGDTLTVVSRPILSVPTILAAGDDLAIEAVAPEETGGWTVELRRNGFSVPLAVEQSSYDAGRERWFLSAPVPADVPAEIYDLVVAADGGIEDEARHAVSVRSGIEDSFYFIHITDTHLPTHDYHYEQGAESDTTEMDDLRAVIQDVNIINPAFVLLTGDVVNEGELEDYLDWRSFTKAKRIMREFDVPVYIVAGNHDVGGWDSTPPPDGTARRNWWKFFGWRRLYDPPPSETIYTQNYAFDYGGVHFVGLEAYDNYDNWRHAVYGRESFTNRQLAWLSSDLALVDPATPVVAFYHYDFGDELNLSTYGIDCALWGHIHRDRGSITEHPFDLATDNLCDGARSMRLVRVQDGQIIPRPSMSAGPSGQSLRLTYDAPNDGTQTAVTATVLNGYPQAFEHGLVKFHVRADSIPYGVDNGDVLQTIVDGDVATVYVNVDIQADAATSVSVEPNTSWVPGGAFASLAQNRPNPAGTGTEIRFVLAFPAEVALEIFDASGRRVATLHNGPLSEGPHRRSWDLTDDAGRTVASGVYFYRLKASDDALTRKLIVVR
jgi:hypothetical protein